jgi:hypothetical protein
MAMLRKKKLIISILGIVFLLFTADYLVGMKEASIIREREAKKERLEKLAFYLIVPDIEDARDIKGAPGQYEVVIKIDNLADEPVYITYPRAIAYVQTGTFWTEVPVREGERVAEAQVIRIDPGIHHYRKIVTINRSIKYTFYQMFGYMHVRVRVSLFVLPESAFKEEEVIDRYSDAYMYLKPYYIPDKEIARQVKFPDNKIPAMIPMPPH